MIETRESEAAAAPSAPEARRVHDSELDALLAAAAEPEDPLRDRTWAESLAGWLLVPDVLGCPPAPRLPARSPGASWTVAADASTGALRWDLVLWTAGGVLLIGLLNFTVSFALALWVAVRARGLGGRRWRDLLRAVWWAFYLRPACFVLPGQ